MIVKLPMWNTFHCLLKPDVSVAEIYTASNESNSLSARYYNDFQNCRSTLSNWIISLKLGFFRQASRIRLLYDISKEREREKKEKCLEKIEIGRNREERIQIFYLF